MSVRSGVERADPVVRYEGELVHTDTYERSFTGQLHYRANVGDRQLSLDLLPAWHSHTVEWTFTRRRDGKPLESESGLPLYELKPVYADPGAGAAPSGADSLDSATIARQAALPKGSFAHHVSPETATAAKVDAQPRRVSGQILDKAMENTGRSISINETGKKTDTDRPVFGLASKKVIGNYEFGQIREKTAEREDRTEGDKVVSRVTIKELNTDYKDLRREEVKRRIGPFRRRTRTNYFAPGERRVVMAKVLTEIETETFRNADGSALAERKFELVPVANENSASSITRTEVDRERAEQQVKQTDQTPRSFFGRTPARETTINTESTVFSDFLEKDTHEVQTQDVGGRRITVHRSTERAGTFEKVSKNGGPEVQTPDQLRAQHTDITKREMAISDGSDGRPMEIATLDGREVEGVNAKPELAEIARDQLTSVTTEYEHSADGKSGGTPSARHTVTQNIQSHGTFSMEEQKSKSDPSEVIWETALVQHKQEVSEHVAGSYKAKLAEASSTEPPDGTNTLTHKDAVRAAEVSPVASVALSDVKGGIELTAQAKTERTTDIYEGAFRPKALNEGKLGGMRHTVRVTDIQDKEIPLESDNAGIAGSMNVGNSAGDGSGVSDGYTGSTSDGDSVPNSPTVSRKRIEQGVDVMLKQQGGSTTVRNGFFIDQTDSQTVEYRAFDKTSNIDQGEGRKLRPTSNSDSNVAHISFHLKKSHHI